MAYVDPTTVISPRNRLRSVDVLYNSGPGPGSWSVALLNFDGDECVGIRWNGSDDEPGIGNPQSRARPTWFIVPGELAAVVRAQVEELANSQAGGLLEGYREMANDQQHEAEALEWSEGLIGDAIPQKG
ncbi:MAG TPA: hypothetical protein VEO19_09850 [Terriglobia bacterium]|jgi:hypothetical protein|nr:hypothetical protein [Terriglobia bacterium]